MESLTINGHNGSFITINLETIYGFPDKTTYAGGYDIRALISINAEGFSVNSNFYTSTGEIFRFIKLLEKCNKTLQGIAGYRSFEGDLDFQVIYTNNGSTEIKGSFTKLTEGVNKLDFDFKSDQTFISDSINKYSPVISKYGGDNGI